MPSKSKRAASRQAKVRQRRRRGKAAPQEFQVGPDERQLDDEEGEPVATPALRTSAATARETSSFTRPSRASRRQRDPDASAEVAPTYPYMGVELRRIGIVAGLIFAILAVLTFVLGG